MQHLTSLQRAARQSEMDEMSNLMVDVDGTSTMDIVEHPLAHYMDLDQRSVKRAIDFDTDLTTAHIDKKAFIPHVVYTEEESASLVPYDGTGYEEVARFEEL